MKIAKLLSVLLLFVSVVGTASTPINQQKILPQAVTLDPDALVYAIKSYQWALKQHKVKNPNVLTIVDFTKPAKDKRMWVIDIPHNKVLMNLYTTHGRGSGTFYAKQFSNTTNSDQSSIGTFVTTSPYTGSHGYSERLIGLEPGINDKAYSRNIVIHPAWYVTEDFVKQNGRTGRSLGCFAVSPKDNKRFIDLTKGGSVLYAYAPEVKHYKSSFAM